MLVMSYAVLYVLLIFCLLGVKGDSNYDRKTELEQLLFPKIPSRTSPNDQYRRALAPDLNDPPEGVDDAVCVICHGLQYCDVLNGLLVEEVYYPQQDELGTCSIIEALGIRMDSEIFGIGRTFRDTPQCRDIVMQYLCLFWGSQNDMYTNLCFWREDVSSPDPENHRISPRPPCRSFCVQISEVCANQADFIDICASIECPPTEDECTPDPVVGGEVVAAGIGCDIPSLLDPYDAAVVYGPSAMWGLLITTVLVVYGVMK